MFKHQLLKKAAAFIASLGLLAALVVTPLSNANHQNYQSMQADVIDVTTDYDQFDPVENNVHISYSITEGAHMTVYIEERGQLVKELIKNDFQNPGMHMVVWDGTDMRDGQYAENGKYTVVIIASNGGGKKRVTKIIDLNSSTGYHHNGEYDVDVYPGSVHTDNDVTTSSFDDDEELVGPISIKNLKVENASFNPAFDRARITYNLSNDAYVSVNVYDKFAHVDTVFQNEKQRAGVREAFWDGHDKFDRMVSTGEYIVRVTAHSGNANDIEDIKVNVDNGLKRHMYDYSDYVNGEITRHSAVPSVFNPYEEDKVRIEYHVDTQSRVVVRIMQGDGLVKVLETGANQRQGDYARIWDGRDTDGDMVAEGAYYYVITAENEFGKDEVSGKIVIDYNKFTGIRVLTEDDYLYNYDYFDHSEPGATNCGEFIDVQAASKYCDAIQYVKDSTIFDGYPDGYFYPNKAIQRDEAVKIIMQTFDVPKQAITGYDDLGFADVDPFAWYMPYLKAARQLAVIHGYPDGLFRPAKTMNRAEFAKVFLETARQTRGINIPRCEGSRPYADVPNTWFKDYACFSKAHELVKTVDEFHFQPGKLMTRGEAAEFAYNFSLAIQ